MSGAELHPYWNGLLCDENRDSIAERMRAVLGDHYFTLVTCNSYDKDSHRFSAVEVCVSQWLSTPIHDYGDPKLAGISWSTPRYAMGVHSIAKTQSEAREGRPHKYVHFSFEPERITIDHFAPAGYRLLWILAVERRDRDEAAQ